MQAYAIAVGDELLVNTVHEHPRGAMVNWLVAYMNYRIMQSTRDEAIREAFLREKDRRAEYKAPLRLVKLLTYSAKEIDPATVDILKGEQ